MEKDGVFMKERNYKRKNILKLTIVLIFCCFTIFSGLFLSMTLEHKVSIAKISNQNALSGGTVNSGDKKSSKTAYQSVTKSEDNQVCYVSDIKYMQGSSVGWGNITLDQNMDSNANGGIITLIINGKKTRFLKGIIAHANSTLLYDISGYDYDYFTSYIGIDESKGANGNGVRFQIYTSQDGETWDIKYTSSILKGNNNAELVKIDITNANYLKLYADKNGNDSYDHATYADAKLVKEGYEANDEPVDFIKTLEEYDEIITNHYGEEITGEYELNLLQREFVKNVGYDILQAYVRLNNNNMDVVSWLMSDATNLRLYLVGGTPIGGKYLSALDVLKRLYTAYKSDLNNTTVTENGVVLGELYRRMMFSLSLTHSVNVGFWANPSGENISNPVTRYQIYKDMHQKKLLDNKVFEKLKVEEMRWVMDNNISDDQIEWLNYYVRQRNNSRDPYTYINYTFDYNYSKNIYFTQENYNKWNAKYHLSDYGVAYKPGLQKLWIVFEEGAVCGGISKTGSNINGAYGVPSAVIGQPGHAAYLQYSKNANGDGFWNIYNDVSGWVESEKGERMLLGWGTCNWDSQYQVSYVQLAQAALNNYDAYENAAEILFLKNVYAGDLEKLESIYRKALERQSINLDAWYGLITTFNANSSKTEEDYYVLAEQLSENLKYYPLPMWDLWNLIKTKFTSPAYIMKFNLLQNRILTEAAKITSGTYQPNITRVMAAHLLGKSNYTVTSFSFDGSNAECIVLSDKFANTEVTWDYSLDGGTTWTRTGEHIHKLTKEEIAQINVNDGIWVHIVGVDYSENNIVKIAITKAGLPTVYNNDWENKVMGATSSMEWRFGSDDEWTSFAAQQPDLTGDKTIQVRQGPTGTRLTSDSVTLSFTQDVVNNKRVYIPIARLSIHSVSSEATANQGNASFAIDGNYNTRWHSAWNGSDQNRFIVVKFDRAIEFSAMEFFPAGGGNGNILKCKLLGSTDGINFEELTTVNWANNDQKKSVDLEEPVRLQYLKIVGVNTSTAGGGSFIAAKMFNFYEDTTVKTVASFSFDGENAQIISLVDEFAGQRWKFSLDGGETWKDTNADSHKLNSDELEQISAENNIKIKFDGDETIYKINIKKGSVPDITPFVSDLENRLLGLYSALSYLEWKIEGQDTWTPYSEQEAIVTGNTKLFVRKRATGTFTASEPLEYQFTEDDQPDTRKYVSVSHQSVHEVSSQENNNSVYAIDGNENTRWHSSFAGTDTEKYYIIKLDNPKYITSLEYVPATGSKNGKVESLQILVSLDGENWTEVVPETDWTYTNDSDRTRKSVDFTATLAQYVKIVGKRTQTTDNTKSYITAAVFSLFEDVTKNEPQNPPTTELENPPSSEPQDPNPDVPQDPTTPDEPQGPNSNESQGSTSNEPQSPTTGDAKNNITDIIVIIASATVIVLIVAIAAIVIKRKKTSKK